jgi:hypothetical protein
MAWRMVRFGDREWHVSLAAERRAHSDRWNLVLSFRAQDGDRRLLWTEYPMSSTSRSALLQQAERIPEAKLADALAEAVNGGR